MPARFRVAGINDLSEREGAINPLVQGFLAKCGDELPRFVVAGADHSRIHIWVWPVSPF
ncbi:MAG: hypothetical protein JOZ14_07700 [Acidobacteria bacterium]|nr:hypothetical protein [Acidobacteriota bacterium]